MHSVRSQHEDPGGVEDLAPLANADFRAPLDCIETQCESLGWIDADEPAVVVGVHVEAINARHVAGTSALLKLVASLGQHLGCMAHKPRLGAPECVRHRAGQRTWWPRGRQRDLGLHFLGWSVLCMGEEALKGGSCRKIASNPKKEAILLAGMAMSNVFSG